MSIDPDDRGEEGTEVEDTAAMISFSQRVREYIGEGGPTVSPTRQRLLGRVLKAAFTVSLSLGFLYWILMYIGGV